MSRAGQRFAGVAQLVERKPSKLDVAGSSPVSRSSEGQVSRFSGMQCRDAGCGTRDRIDAGRIARVAQLVEHTLGKGEVTGSIPVASSEDRSGELQRHIESTAARSDRLSRKIDHRLRGVWKSDDRRDDVGWPLGDDCLRGLLAVQPFLVSGIPVWRRQSSSAPSRT